MRDTELHSSRFFDLSRTRSIGNTFVAELRDAGIQQDPLRFRRNMERIGECLGYELSKRLSYTDTEITTPLGSASCQLLSEQPVLATILRAGLPMQQGLLNIFDRATCAFIAAYRKVKKNGDFIIQMDYVSTPDLNGRVLIMVDPMLATGQSMVMCCKELCSRFQVSELHIVAAIASSEGISHVRANMPDAFIWTGAVDEEMTSRSYIVPGLGDAGDLAYGEKL